MKQIKNYQQAREYLGNKKERPFANNTRIEIDSLDLGHDVITVKYHGNPVVNMFPDGTNTYSSCGWKTITTKERINWFLPDGFQLWQEKSVWYISNRQEGKRWLFADGIAVKDGEVYNAASESEQDSIKKQIKAIKKYVDGYVKALLNNEIESPSGGDCWYCCMRDTESNKPLGELTNSEHIQSHLEESYYVPSLLVNAFRFTGRSSMIGRDGISRLMDGESIDAWQSSLVTRDVKSCLTAYLKHEFGIAQ
jgi:hypothetical protein